MWCARSGNIGENTFNTKRREQRTPHAPEKNLEASSSSTPREPERTMPALRGGVGGFSPRSDTTCVCILQTHDVRVRLLAIYKFYQACILRAIQSLAISIGYRMQPM